MSKDTLQKEMDKFYKRYEVIDGFEDADTAEVFILKKYKKYKEAGVITLEEYNAKFEELKNSHSDGNSISFKKIFKMLAEDTIKKYPDSIEAYKSIINSTAQLCHELNLKDSMDIFVVFNYLLWNGYFSKDKNYIYTLSERKNLMGYFGTDIINGKGVCLNKSYMLDNILNTMDYKSYMICNKVPKKIIRDYKPNIERRIKKHGQIPMKINAFLFSPITNITGNHACTLVEKDDVYYVYDPTNLCVFKLDKFLQAGIIGGTGIIDIKPYSLSWFGNLDNKKITEIVESYKNVENETHPYDIEDIKSSFESNLELCRNNTGLFNDFYNANEPNRSRVLKIFKG
jgi:hypothetical protein